MSFLPVGKIPHALCADLLAGIPVRDPRVIVGPDVGEDAAVIDVGDRFLVVKTDPITFAADRIGWYAVHINANDIACMGGTPRWMLVTILLPEGATEPSLVETIIEDLVAACNVLDITVCGGHTEVTHGLTRPILVGQMLGEVEKEMLVRKDTVTPGDIILLTKGVAIEGTCVLARELGDVLSRQVEESVVARAKAFLADPGISVVREARAAVSRGAVHAMHDPTEGGLYTALWELAHRAKVGMHVREDAVVVLPETRILCDILGLDPMGLLASGALLVVVAPAHAGEVMESIRREGIQCVSIGEIREASYGIMLETRGILSPMMPFRVDELARVFDERIPPTRGGAL